MLLYISIIFTLLTSACHSGVGQLFLKKVTPAEPGSNATDAGQTALAHAEVLAEHPDRTITFLKAGSYPSGENVVIYAAEDSDLLTYFEAIYMDQTGQRTKKLIALPTSHINVDISEPQIIWRNGYGVILFSSATATESTLAVTYLVKSSQVLADKTNQITKVPAGVLIKHATLSFISDNQVFISWLEKGSNYQSLKGTFLEADPVTGTISSPASVQPFVISEVSDINSLLYSWFTPRTNKVSLLWSEKPTPSSGGYHLIQVNIGVDRTLDPPVLLESDAVMADGIEISNVLFTRDDAERNMITWLEVDRKKAVSRLKTRFGVGAIWQTETLIGEYESLKFAYYDSAFSLEGNGIIVTAIVPTNEPGVVGHRLYVVPFQQGVIDRAVFYDAKDNVVEPALARNDAGQIAMAWIAGQKPDFHISRAFYGPKGFDPPSVEYDPLVEERMSRPVLVLHSNGRLSTFWHDQTRVLFKESKP